MNEPEPNSGVGRRGDMRVLTFAPIEEHLAHSVDFETRIELKAGAGIP